MDKDAHPTAFLFQKLGFAGVSPNKNPMFSVKHGIFYWVIKRKLQGVID
ncbi:MAG: hypothetical protein IK065_06190 [Neisseriaceae bacterium]|nr:hypothetical protein [Neisseriaceae bacterium]